MHGADFSGDIDDQHVADIWAALDKHLVLVFRGQKDPTDAQLMAFGRRFGHIPRTGLKAGANPNHNEILICSSIVENGQTIGVGTPQWMDWHTDYSFRPRVSQIGFLSAVELPRGGGGETLFTDMYTAYESLPEDLRQRLHTYRARHALRAGYEDVIEEGHQGEVTVADLEKETLIPAEGGTVTVHPLIAQNPRTGRRAVYVNPLNTKRILELDLEASHELLKKLFATAGEPSRTYAHDWVLGDIVMWDQLGTLHARRPYNPMDRRKLRKVVTIFADPAEPWRHSENQPLHA